MNRHDREGFKTLFHSDLLSRKMLVSARRMLACDGYWRFTALRFRNFRQRIHLQPKPSSRLRPWIRRSGPDRESRYFEACSAGEKMSPHSDGRMLMAATDIGPSSSRSSLRNPQQSFPQRAGSESATGRWETPFARVRVVQTSPPCAAIWPSNATYISLSRST